jgi:hypothetical protein
MPSMMSLKRPVVAMPAPARRAPQGDEGCAAR